MKTRQYSVYSIAPGKDPNAPTPGNVERTIYQHEQARVSYLREYLRGVDLIHKPRDGLCVCAGCYRAWERFAAAGVNVLQFERAVANVTLDAMDYPEGDAKARRNADISLFNDGLQKAKVQKDAAHAAMRDVCDLPDVAR